MSADWRVVHGYRAKGSHPAAYRAWSSMKVRCLNKKHPSWPRYGGRGITVCERWMVYANFIADMGENPKGKSLDRIDNNGNYEPSNCRWATSQEQTRNTSYNRFIEVDGQRLCYADWAKILGITRESFSSRVARHGPQKAVRMGGRWDLQPNAKRFAKHPNLEKA